MGDHRIHGHRRRRLRADHRGLFLPHEPGAGMGAAAVGAAGTARRHSVHARDAAERNPEHDHQEGGGSL